MRKIIHLLNGKLFKEALFEAEKEIYLAAYYYAGQNQTHAAKLLGVARGTFIRKMKGYTV